MGVRWIHYLRKEELEAKLIFLSESCEGKVIELRKRLAEASNKATWETKETFEKWEEEFLKNKEAGAYGIMENLDEDVELMNDIGQSTIIN